MTPENQDSPTVIILAAGKGTRMCSELPKVLHRVCGKSLLERAVEAAAGVNPRKNSGCYWLQC